MSKHTTHIGTGPIAWFSANPVAANLLMIIVIMLGIIQGGQLRKESFPDPDPDSLTISFTYNSGSAKQSEEGIAIKIEDQLEDVSGIKTVTSRTTGYGATITVEKQSGYDLDLLLSDVKNKVDGISTFPVDARKPVIKKARREHHGIWLQLYGNADRQVLQSLAERLKQDLLAQSDISNVSISGWLNPALYIEIEEGKLEAYDLSLSDVEDAINANSSTPMTAVMRNESLYLQLKASKQAYLKADFAQIPLKITSKGQQILLGDVAHVLDSYDDQTASLSRFQGKNSIAIEVVTTGLQDITDTVAASKQVAQRWLNEGKLPQGVQLKTWHDRSQDIKSRLALLTKNAATGTALVFILLALFLNLTVAFWVAAGLPFVFFGTLFFMGDQFTGLTLNEFTTFGFILALGIVVDDAVVVGESIYSERSKHGDTLANTVKGTLRVATPTIFGVLTTVAAFFALSNIEGKLGELYSQFAAIVSICLLMSVVESKLILPSHLAHLKTKTNASSGLGHYWQLVQSFVDRGMQWFSQRIYTKAITFALIHRYAITMLFMALFIFVITMPLSGIVKFSFFPGVPGETVKANLTMQNDASFGQTHRNLLRMESLAYATDRQLLNNEEASSAIAHLQLLSANDQTGEVTVELVKNAPYSLQDFTREWQNQIGQPEATRSVNVRSRRAPTDDLRIELRANDDTILFAAGDQIKLALGAYAAVSGIEDNLQPGQPQLNLVLNQQGRALGLTTNSLAIQILQGFSGQIVQRYQRNSDEIEVKVRYPEADRQNIADVLNARVRTPDGNIIGLSSVASVTTGYTRDSITRINNKRAVYITANVDKDILSSTALVSQLQQTLVPQLESQYPTLDVHFAGEAEQQAETQSSMVSMFMVAMLVIYMLLAIPLKSYSQPLIIMCAIPFGIVGAILGHLYNDIPLSILSFNGIIALSGVVVNDSLLLVARFNDIRQSKTSVTEAIQLACTSRLRAVLLTSFTTYAGLIPLLGETSRQAQFLIPAAVSLGYGIMFATVITLILIPSLLMIQVDLAKSFKRTRIKLRRALPA